MSRVLSDKITYKPYNQGEQLLLTPSLEELVSQKHFVRIVSKIEDELEIVDVFTRIAKGGEVRRYNPAMLFKVLIYCYMTGNNSSRRIARKCRENVNVIWLTGFQKPDFITISTFRSEKLKVFLIDVEEITEKDNQIYNDRDFAGTGDDTPVTSEEIKAVAEQINKKLAEINGLEYD